MLISSNNLTIRNAVATDAEILHRWWNDGAIMEHAGFPNGLGLKLSQITDKISHCNDNNVSILIAELDNIPIGEMNYRNMGNRVAEIGIKICNFTQQNIGYGKILLRMLINSLFSDYDYKKIVVNTDIGNIRAQHVYEQLGFIKTKVNKDCWTDQTGQLRTSVEYCLINPN